MYLQHYNRHSGDAIRPVVKNITLVTGWGYRDFNSFIFDCTLCGLCGKRCPANIDMGQVNRFAREHMVKNEIMPLAMHAFPLRDMEYSINDMRLVQNQSGFEQSRYALYPGCQLPASMPDTVEKLYGHLTENIEGGVGLIISCCGAPAIWAAREDQAAQARDTLRADWESLGRPELIITCPGCYKVLRETMPDIPICFVTQVLAEKLPKEVGKDTAQYAYHDPCASRNYDEIQISGRDLATKCGVQLEELPQSHHHTVCCGYGGLQYHLHPELARMTTGARINQSPLPYLTSCSNCRDFFTVGGKRCLHLLELVFGQEENKGSSPFAEIDFSKRRQQRRALNRRLMQTFWSVTLDVEVENMDVVISDAMREKLNAQHILEDDVKCILRETEKTGRRMLEKETGHYVAYHREGYVTIWLEYTLEGDRTVLQNAYSHRMQIMTK